VNVGINQPRKYCRIAKILDVRLGRYLIRRNYAADSLSFYQHGGRTHSVRGYYPAGRKGAQTHDQMKVPENSVRMKTEPSFISALFQDGKIDSNLEKDADSPHSRHILAAD
jgi:hypothetical protein